MGLMVFPELRGEVATMKKVRAAVFCFGPNRRPGRQRYNRRLHKNAGVAQSVEQLIRNEKVGCSIHLSGTK